MQTSRNVRSMYCLWYNYFPCVFVCALLHSRVFSLHHIRTYIIYISNVKVHICKYLILRTSYFGLEDMFLKRVSQNLLFLLLHKF